VVFIHATGLHSNVKGSKYNGLKEDGKDEKRCPTSSISLQRWMGM
jgi:hypothetical protein